MKTSENAGGREAKTVVLACRVSEKFAELVKEYCRLDMHLNPADLLRDSLREKIQRERPDLCNRLFQEAKLVE